MFDEPALGRGVQSLFHLARKPLVIVHEALDRFFDQRFGAVAAFRGDPCQFRFELGVKAYFHAISVTRPLASTATINNPQCSKLAGSKSRVNWDAAAWESSRRPSTPWHRVTLTKGYWIGRTEVTQAAYELVIGANPSHFKGDGNLPVEQVNWNEAKLYCETVNMRLPTEAEWEYAACGGDSSARYGPLDKVAWYDGNSGKTTHPVAQKQKNGYGLYDMLGNVYEWTADYYGEKYYTTNPPPDNWNNPRGPASGGVGNATRWFLVRQST
jgi:formylglycine-generating enzyme required for sulfatase activity